MSKANNRFEFREELDMNPFLSSPLPSHLTHYRLQSYFILYLIQRVLVHRGDLNRGHYFSYVRNTFDGPWLRCNDNEVDPVPVKDVIEGSWGGQSRGANACKN